MSAWSYSSIKTFSQCPKKYFHLKVARDVKDTPGEAALYGTAVHEAAENYIADGVPIPEKYAYMRPIVEALGGLPGEKFVELKLGVKDASSSYAPCDFHDPEVWWHGIVDLLIVDGSTAHMVDYKTGKSARYADMKQLDLMAGAVFSHFPEVMKVKSALAFVVSNDFLKKLHLREHQQRYMGVFESELERLDAARENGVWNAKTSGLCGWCPVSSCEHWTPRRR